MIFFRKNPESENFRFNPKISDTNSDFFHLRTSPRRKKNSSNSWMLFLLYVSKILIRKNPINSEYFQFNCQSSEESKQKNSIFPLTRRDFTSFLVYFSFSCYQIDFLFKFQIFFLVKLQHDTSKYEFFFLLLSQGHRRGRSGQMATFHGIGGIILLWRLLRPRCVRLLRLCTIQVNFFESYLK